MSFLGSCWPKGEVALSPRDSPDRSTDPDPPLLIPQNIPSILKGVPAHGGAGMRWSVGSIL